LQCGVWWRIEQGRVPFPFATHWRRSCRNRSLKRISFVDISIQERFVFVTLHAMTNLELQFLKPQTISSGELTMLFVLIFILMQWYMSVVFLAHVRSDDIDFDSFNGHHEAEFVSFLVPALQ